MTRKKGPVRVKALPLTDFASGAAPSLPVLTDAETSELVSRPWNLAGVSDDGRRLVLSVASTTRLRGVQITETAEEATVTVYATPPSPGPSVMSHLTAFASVLLSSPLSDRRLSVGRQQ